MRMGWSFPFQVEALKAKPCLVRINCCQIANGLRECWGEKKFRTSEFGASDGLHGCYEFRASLTTSGDAFTMRVRFRWPVFSLFVITLVVRLRSCCAFTRANAWPRLVLDDGGVADTLNLIEDAVGSSSRGDLHLLAARPRSRRARHTGRQGSPKPRCVPG